MERVTRASLVVVLVTSAAVAACQVEFDYTADYVRIGLCRDLVVGDTITLSAGAYLPDLRRGVDSITDWRILSDSEPAPLAFVVKGVETSFVEAQHEVVVRAVSPGEAVISAVETIQDPPLRDQCTIDVSEQVTPVTPHPGTAAPATPGTSPSTGSSKPAGPVSPSP